MPETLLGAPPTSGSAAPLPARLAVFDPAGWIANLERLLEARDEDEIAVDLRANAYGHGLARCRELLGALARERGARLVALVSDGELEADIGPDPVLGAAAAPGAEPAPAVIATDDRLARRAIGPESFGLAADDGLPPVLRLQAELMLVKVAAAGEAVSYGRSYRIDADTRLGLLAIGYSDGAIRRASNVADVAVRGRRCRIAGAISMDQLVIDLGDAPADPGEHVVLYGDGSDGGPTAIEWAQRTGVPAPAITARIASTVARSESSRTRFDAPERDGTAPLRIAALETVAGVERLAPGREGTPR